MPAWNPKCYRVDRVDGVDRGLGLCFDATFKMSNAPQITRGEIVDFDEGRSVTYRYTDFGKPGSWVEEAYAIRPQGAGACVLLRTLDLSKSGLPLLVRIIAGFIMRFGWKAGAGPLDGVAALLEATDRD